MNQTIVISLGGSIIVPKEIDTKYLTKFRRIVLQRIRYHERAVIVTGGGATSRNYYNAAKAVATFSADDLDRVGIAATRLNAELVRSQFGRLAHQDIIINPIERLRITRPIVVAAGWKPGRSTDYVAVLLAKNMGARAIINVTNIDYVYTANPKKYHNAKPLPDLTWSEYLKLVPKRWSPRLSSPFDPVASRLAKKLGITVMVVNANNIVNLNKAISGKSFQGTIIHP
ncbi:MAG: UMP kinase [Patescibacteria group bacterium]|jgi:uridylate kinase